MLSNKSIEPWSEWEKGGRASCQPRKKPIFTKAVILVCTVVLIFSFRENKWKIEPIEVNPMIGPNYGTLVRLGATKTSLILNGEWWRVVSSSFLHAGIVHWLVNVLGLWVLGSALEQRYGFLTIAFLFIVPDIFGNLLSSIFLADDVSVGASGGICGLVGAMLADIFTNWDHLFNQRVNVDADSTIHHKIITVCLFFDILINIAFGLTPLINNFCHAGGFFVGFFCGLSTSHHVESVFFESKRGLLRDRIWELLVRLHGMIISAIAFIFAIYTLLNNDGKPVCPKCKYISCVPFPFWVEYDKKWWN